MKIYYQAHYSRNKCKYIWLRWKDAERQVFIHDEDKVPK